MKLLVRTLAIAAAVLTAAAAFALPPATTSKHAKPHHGLMSLLHRPKPTRPTVAHKPLFAGNIIGNKRTHVYHMPGDPGALPAPQNRIYFRTQAQAVAAGYRRAGSRAHKAIASPRKIVHKPMMRH